MKVKSVFNSIDGEVNYYHQGRCSTFIRFSGCNLKCSYCDTIYAQDKNSGIEMSNEEILMKIEKIGCRKITITGGEPLLQAVNLSGLLVELDKRNYWVSIETNGSLSPVQTQLNNVTWVMDWKLPSSGMQENMRENNFLYLGGKDFIKFVIGNESDFDRCLEVKEYLEGKGCKARFALSPMVSGLSPSKLVEWIQEVKLFDVIVNLQLHKYIWPVINENEER